MSKIRDLIAKGKSISFNAGLNEYRDLLRDCCPSGEPYPYCIHESKAVYISAYDCADGFMLEFEVNDLFGLISKREFWDVFSDLKKAYKAWLGLPKSSYLKAVVFQENYWEEQQLRDRFMRKLGFSPIEEGYLEYEFTGIGKREL
jgi:hypothetical protein